MRKLCQIFIRYGRSVRGGGGEGNGYNCLPGYLKKIVMPCFPLENIRVKILYKFL